MVRELQYTSNALVVLLCHAACSGDDSTSAGRDAAVDDGGPTPDAIVSIDGEPSFRAGVDQMLHDANAWLDAYTGTVDGMFGDTTAPRWFLASAIYESSGELVTGRDGTGRAMRANLVPGTEVAVNWQTAPADGLLGGYAPVTATIVTSFWFRISPGFMPSDVGAKFYEYWIPGGGARSQIGVTRFGFDEHRFLLNPNSTGNFGAQPRGPFWEDLNDGAWHRFTHLRRPNTSADRSVGIERVWIDGRKILDISAEARGVTPADGDRPWCTDTDLQAISTDGIGYYWLPAYFNNPLPAAGTIDLDDFVAWRLAE